MTNDNLAARPKTPMPDERNDRTSTTLPRRSPDRRENALFRKLSAIRLKLSMWGFKGAINWALRQRRAHRERRRFLDNARKYPFPVPERGVTILGPISAFGSLSKVLRDFAFCLKDAGIPFQTFDTGEGGRSNEAADILTPPAEFRIGRFTHSVEMLVTKIPDGVVRKRSKILFWEFNEGVCEGNPCILDNDDDIIAMSDFNYGYFKRTFANRVVHRLPYPLRIDVSGIPGKAECRAKFGFNPADFIVFYNFNYHSGFHRKNPLGVIKAFAASMRAAPEARLVFKTQEHDLFPALESEVLKLAESEGIRDRLVLFNDPLPHRDVYALTNACDVYCSLHRAEGFGLGIAEAMALSKAVVATDYSATTEFCKPQNSLLVPFRLTEATPAELADAPSYRWCRQWAEPDLDAAADALRRLYRDRDLRLELGAAACAFVNEKYSTENFRKAVERWLDADNDVGGSAK